MNDLLQTIYNHLNTLPLAEQLTPLFCGTLRWGAPRGLTPRGLPVGGPDRKTLTTHPVAQLSGLPVYRVDWPEDRLPGVTARRAVHRALAPVHAEHLLCYLTRDGRQAAFTWAHKLADAKTELRTLPYEVGSPARTTIERLRELAFSVDELGPTGQPPIQLVTDKLSTAFSVEAVTGQFFEDYKTVFADLQKRLAKVTRDKSWAHDYALQLLNRLMFLYFIQRKRWLGDDPRFLTNFWNAYKTSNQPNDSFFHAWLSVLFFEAFNNKFHGGHWHFPKSIRQALQMAPYLNGGLFTRNHLDDAHDVSIPDEFFAMLFDSFAGSEPGFLERYNFTIAESTPLDIDVAVDPEMIGKVYESLVNITFEGLTEGDRRGSAGIFYTPRIEIDLMCRLSLVDALANHLGQAYKPLLYDVVFAYDPDAKDAADRALGAQNLWPELSGLLRGLTVCDPACGSGSFLVGMLLVLDDLQARANAQLGIKETPYERRRRIIGEQLYGVDVMDWAVHVAELRLWLQLVVETELKAADLKFRPLLPNLSFKLRSGDSLVQEIGGINFGLHRSHLDIPAHLKRRLTQLKGRKLRFYHGEAGLRESDLKAEEVALFREILQHKRHAVQNAIATLNGKIERATEQGELPGMTSGKAKEERVKLEERWRAERDEKQAELHRIDQALAGLRTARDVPFAWDIAFVEIFESDKSGFDIVIGNPPYVGKELIAPPTLDPDDYGGETSDRWKELKKAYKLRLQESVAAAWPRFFRYKPGRSDFRKPDGKSDLYVYFYLHGLSLLNERGSFCFITSNSWLDVGYGKDLQEFLLRHSHVKLIVDNERKRSFAQAEVNTTIVLLAPADDRTDRGLGHTARFAMFKVPFKDLLSAEVFKAVAEATKPQSTDCWRVRVITQHALLEEGRASDDEHGAAASAATIRGPFITAGRYVGNKWGGRYLRAPDIFSIILSRNHKRLRKLGELCRVEGYIHDNNIGSSFPRTHFIKSVKDTETIAIGRSSPGVTLYGVKATGNSRMAAPILFPRTLGDRHVVIWNPEGVLGKEFYKVLPAHSDLAIGIAAQLNSAFGILQRELIGVVNLGAGGLKFSADDVRSFLVVKELDTSRVASAFLKMATRRALPIADEIAQSDRRALDDMVFDVLGLTAGEREAVYQAVLNLVGARLAKARSV